MFTVLLGFVTRVVYVWIVTVVTISVYCVLRFVTRAVHLLWIVTLVTISVYCVLRFVTRVVYVVWIVTLVTISVYFLFSIPVYHRHNTGYVI